MTTAREALETLYAEVDEAIKGVDEANQRLAAMLKKHGLDASPRRSKPKRTKKNALGGAITQKRRGRPPGSKNKKPRIGRPPGSKNKRRRGRKPKLVE